MNLHSFSLYSDYSYPLTLSIVGEPSWSWISRGHIQAQIEKKIRRCLFTSSIKPEMRHFHVVVVQKLERNVQKVWCTCEVVVLLIKPIFSLTFSFLSASLDLKVPINDQVSVSWLAQLFSALHQYRRGRVLNPGKPESFQAFFSHKLRLYLRGSSLLFFSSCVDLSHGSFVLFLHKHSSSRVQIFQKKRETWLRSWLQIYQ